MILLISAVARTVSLEFAFTLPVVSNEVNGVKCIASSMLLECNLYNVVRQRYFNVSSLHELFDMVNAQNILGFIRDIGLYRLM